MKTDKILQNMIHSGLCSQDEVDRNTVSQFRIEMYIRQIPIVQDVPHSVKEHLSHYESELSSGNKDVSKYVRKLKKMDEVPVKMMPAKNQDDAIKNHLMLHGNITSYEAFVDYGITRLSDKIFRLRNDGWSIDTEYVSKKNRFGNPVSYAKYNLIKSV